MDLGEIVFCSDCHSVQFQFLRSLLLDSVFRVEVPDYYWSLRNGMIAELQFIANHCKITRIAQKIRNHDRSSAPDSVHFLSPKKVAKYMGRFLPAHPVNSLVMSNGVIFACLKRSLRCSRSRCARQEGARFFYSETGLSGNGMAITGCRALAGRQN